MDASLRKNIDWVGFVDWNVRDFHGYTTSRGSTYNSYLVRDDKTALIDTVKAQFADNLLANVAALTSLSKISYIVVNHAEPDHSGALPEVVKALAKAEIVCNAKCKDALSRHYDTTGWRFKVIADGEKLSLGSRTLAFYDTPMVHWPESMATYVEEEKLLFSMDAFGQHIASSARFDDEADLSIVMEEAKKYYANIVMLYGAQIAKAMGRLGALKIETIAPSHGIIWRKNIGMILDAYRGWTALKPAPKALVIYDTMWKSTEAMALAILEGASLPGVEAKLINIRASDKTDIATEVLDAAALALGSPVLNNGIMPEMASLLTYLKGLKPAGKACVLFGSHGWAKGAAVRIMDEFAKAMKLDSVREPIEAQFRPTADALAECRSAGRLLAERALAAAGKTAEKL